MLVHAVYDELPQRARRGRAARASTAILFDLGVSSMQLDEAERGFAYSQDAPLDMRMDPTRGITAADVLNTYAAAELARVLREYGEEKFARRIADAVVRERGRERRSTPAPAWSSSIRDSIPAPARRTGGNPAKRTFQALRIEVNGELEVLERALPAAIDALERRRPHRRHVLPVARGPDHQARVDIPGHQRRAASTCPFVPEGHEPELRLLTRSVGEGVGHGDRREPPRSIGAAARRRADAGGGMSATARAHRDAVPRRGRARRARAPARHAPVPPCARSRPRPRPWPATACSRSIVAGLLVARHARCCSCSTPRSRRARSRSAR